MGQTSPRQTVLTSMIDNLEESFEDGIGLVDEMSDKDADLWNEQILDPLYKIIEMLVRIRELSQGKQIH